MPGYAARVENLLGRSMIPHKDTVSDDDHNNGGRDTVFRKASLDEVNQAIHRKATDWQTVQVRERNTSHSRGPRQPRLPARTKKRRTVEAIRQPNGIVQLRKKRRLNPNAFHDN
ncbi:MAG: hypothetical protein M1818_001631 [Claussenomyces sp. TS43310]|nr:MAG: hypothetical protein M1818_001631 [Claussenomyces sp. TS43310]